MNTRQVDAKTLIAHAFAVHQAGLLERRERTVRESSHSNAALA